MEQKSSPVLHVKVSHFKVLSRRTGFKVFTLGFFLLGMLISAVSFASVLEQNLMASARASIERGQWQAAEVAYKEMLRQARLRNAIDLELDAAYQLAQLYTDLGRATEARSVLESVTVLVGEHASEAVQIRYYLALSQTYWITRQFENAEATLRLAERLQVDDPQLNAALQNTVGNYMVVRGDLNSAEKHYERAQIAVEQTNDLQLLRSIVLNRAKLSLSQQHFKAAHRYLQEAFLVDMQPDGVGLWQRLFQNLASARIASALYDASGNAKTKLLMNEAKEIYEKVYRQSKDADLPILSAQAAGGLADLYFVAGQNQRALEWSRRAVWSSQQSSQKAQTYRWEWTAARSLMGLGQVDLAIKTYERAIHTMQDVRYDLFSGYSNVDATSSFRHVVGPLLYEYVDILLTRARTGVDASGKELDLLAARDALELFRSVEIEDYFHDECVSALEKEEIDVSDIGVNTGILYVFPLENRTEILLTLSSGLRQIVSPVSRETLNSTVRSFRTKLQNRTTHEYLEEAAQLYKWLIDPVLETLREEGVDTLVFVPDGELRSIPMSVLYDESSDEYLIQKFAIANSPGLSLMDSRPLASQAPAVLISALSEQVQGFPGLPFVASEVETLQGLYNAKTLMNKNFTLDKLTSAFESDSYNIVHIASHGYFGGVADDTYLLTYDGRIQLDALEKLVRPTQFRKQPIELLTLSACETAAGDDRSALGLAGLAIKAGARSTLATLWSVNDQASSQLVGQFYENLSSEEKFSKAEALRRSQLDLLSDMRYTHPFYWSPFLIIGNWL